MRVSSMRLEPWAEVRTARWPNVLLGNGFSINIHGGFAYPALLDHSRLPDPAKTLFDEIKTHDFETVMRVLASARAAARALALSEEGFAGLYEQLRQALIDAVRTNHVAHNVLPEGLLAYVGRELARYDYVYTTNYDLLPYWATMDATDDSTERRLFDFFGRDSETGDLSWRPDVHGRDCPGLYFLHGALHLTTDPYLGGTSKTSAASGSLLDTVFRSWSDRGSVPLFVSEGDAAQKAKAIQQSPYLLACYRALQTSPEGIIVLGHSLGEQDGHIAAALRYSQARLAIGLHGDNDDDLNREMERLSNGFPRQQVRFFRSEEHPLTHVHLRDRPPTGIWHPPAEEVAPPAPPG